ncbi:septum formation initiator, partial [Saccharothrix algeriensis]
VQAVVRGPAPTGIRARQVARAVGVPVLATMRPERRLDTALDQGRFPVHRQGPLAVAARSVLAALRERENQPPQEARLAGASRG